MRNDVHPPPPDPDELPRPARTKPTPETRDVTRDVRIDRPIRQATTPTHGHLEPHQDLREPGKHHARILGDATRTDPLYAMPMEERGSSFNIWMSVLALCIALAIIGAFYRVFK